MKKPTQKRIKECIKNIDSNFSELIDAIIAYENLNMDDYSYEIIGYLEKQENFLLVKQLIKDLLKRNSLDKSNTLYKSIWYAILNCDQEKENTHSIIIEKITNENREDVLIFIDSLDDGGDSDGEINARILLRLLKQKENLTNHKILS